MTRITILIISRPRFKFYTEVMIFPLLFNIVYFI